MGILSMKNSSVTDLCILKHQWKEYVIVPQDIRYYWEEKRIYDCTKAYIDKLADSMRIEGFANIRGDLIFNNESKVSDFLLNYKQFFKEEFIDFVIKEALETNWLSFWTLNYEPYIGSPTWITNTGTKPNETEIYYTNSTNNAGQTFSELKIGY